MANTSVDTKDQDIDYPEYAFFKDHIMVVESNDTPPIQKMLKVPEYKLLALPNDVNLSIHLLIYFDNYRAE